MRALGHETWMGVREGRVEIGVGMYWEGGRESRIECSVGVRMVTKYVPGAYQDGFGGRRGGLQEGKRTQGIKIVKKDHTTPDQKLGNDKVKRFIVCREFYAQLKNTIKVSNRGVKHDRERRTKDRRTR